MSVLYQCYTVSVENHNKFYEKRLKKYVRKSNSPERRKKKTVEYIPGKKSCVVKSFTVLKKNMMKWYKKNETQRA